jgi:AraC family transcriptional regulator, regulatory protein of adaptative response / methylated-DNA-[protein]-cysteine methyltransferase
VRSRDPQADGSFFYGVKTTGVYCRPSCASRPARRENVSFFESCAAAERSGFRACKRCKPDQAPAAERAAHLVADLCRLIDSSAELPTLAMLAKRAGASPFHTHRLFKAVTGLTPRAYAAARRAARLLEGLQARATVTEAFYAAGYNSSGRFYEEAGKLLGMTPSQYKAGGANHPMHFAVGVCSLGSILVAATARGVCAIALGDDPDELIHELESRFPRAELIGSDPSFERLVAQVVGLVEGRAPDERLPLDIRGTAFQRRVWQALCAIPKGETVSYAELARRLGDPKAARAVAGACAANVLAVAIPCHRVVRTDGSLCGYRWGVARKRQLLDREARTWRDS